MTDNNSPGMVELTAPGANPLQKFFRQPKLYITLPSKGRWYPAGALETTENGELAVFAMTAKDELTLKTPDALINGAATVEIIQSCVPNILNAWVMPSIDVDALLIAIRIATYGPTMDVEVTAPNTTEANNFQMNLRQVLETVGVEEFVEDVPTTTPGLQVKIRPVTYKEYTSAALQTFEEERMFRIVNDGDLEQERKLELFGETFNKIRDLTVGMISNSIVSITVDNVEVTNRVHITDFIDNADKSVFADITKHIETEKTKHAVKPLKVFATEEQLELGAPKEFEVPIVFDQSTFFA